jgi:hypothetical protein
MKKNTYLCFIKLIKRQTLKVNIMEKQTLNVSVPELVEILKQVDKSTFVSLTTETEVRMNKTGNPYFGQVKKLSTCNYLMGNDYETRVNSNEVKEGLNGTFESLKPSGKHHVSKCVLIDDKTESVHYLMVERFDEITPKVEYKFNGNPIDKMLFQDFLVKTSGSSRQEQERKVMVITPKVESIKEMSLNGVHYIVE